MSFWKKVGSVLKKVAAPALGIAGAAYGMGGLGNAIGGMFSAKDPMGEPNAGPQVPDISNQRVDIPGKPMGFWEKYGDQITSAAVPTIGGALGLWGQSKTNAANAAQAQRQMDFQNQQSSTSYQRGVADMKAAGLNPMLAYSQGGASTGSGASATMGNEFGSGVNSAFDALTQLQNLENLRATGENIQADTVQKQAGTANMLADKPRIENVSRGSSEYPGWWKANREEVELGNALRRGTMESAIASAKSTAANLELETQKRSYGLERDKAEAGFYKDDSFWSGGKYAFHRNEIRENINSAARAADSAAGAIIPWKRLVQSGKSRQTDTRYRYGKDGRRTSSQTIESLMD